MDESVKYSGMIRLAARLGVLLVVLFLGYLFWVARQIQQQSTTDDAQKADVIIVMGAAEYRGRPSPVLQGRLNHALHLYLKGMAPYILTTGGAGGDPNFTEGEVGRSYLTRHGVEPQAIITENKGATTVQSANSAAETMRRMNLTSCIVVSDGYHIYRVKRLLQSHGLRVYGSPRPAAVPPGGRQLNWLYLRQAIGFVLWQVGISV